MAHVLLLGSDRDRTRGLRTLLRQDRHLVHLIRETERWREGELAIRPDVVVAAVGSEEPVLASRPKAGRGFPAPLLFIRHEDDPAPELHLEDRLVDRLASPFTAEEFLARVDALVRVRRVVLRTAQEDDSESPRRWTERLAALLGTRLPRYARPPGPYFEVATRLADWSDRRDTFEPGHAERVSTFSAMIADQMGLPDSEAGILLRAAMLHDIGKVTLPVEILRRQGPLEEGQLRLMRTHPERGAALLRALGPDEGVAQAVLLHHERVDGSGYYGKRTGTIPRTARILAVAEAYDAMTTTTVRARLTTEEALDTLRSSTGWLYDGECVAALESALRPAPRTIPLAP